MCMIMTWRGVRVKIGAKNRFSSLVVSKLLPQIIINLQLSKTKNATRE